LIWEYHPGRYKTEHHNNTDDPDQERTLFLGPRAQGRLPIDVGHTGKVW
jgi:hypothetical protein